MSVVQKWDLRHSHDDALTQSQCEIQLITVELINPSKINQRSNKLVLTDVTNPELSL